MKKTPLLITSAVVLFVLVLYLGYKHFFTERPTRVWDLVPSDAVVVYEKNNCNSCLDVVASSVLVDIIDRISFYKEPTDSIRLRIEKFLKDKTDFLISTHITKKDDFDFVYYIPNNTGLRAQDFFKTSKYKSNSREFNDVTIHEVKISNQTFSYASIGKIWFGSLTPFLVEDVIRTYRSNQQGDNQMTDLRIDGFTSIKDDAGNLYIRLEYLSDLLSVFSSAVSGLNYPIGQVAGLDIKSDGNTLVLNGFSSQNTDQANNVLSIFRHQSPVPFSLKHLISNRTIAISSYGISDGVSFYSDLKKFASRNNPRLQDTLNTLFASQKIDLADLYGRIDDEAGVCLVESLGGRKLSKFLLIKTTGAGKWTTVLQSLAQNLSKDTIFYERYSQYEIREVPVHRFAEKLLWPLAKGFDQNFYTSIGNVIILGDNLEALKDFLDDIDAENTWGRSVVQNRFLESTLLESNVSIYFNPSKAWNILAGTLHPRWSNFLRENQAMLQSVQSSSIQFSHLNNNYYTNILFTYKPFVASNNRVAGSGDRTVTNFDRNLANLHTVRSHVNRSNEVLVQDSLNDLSLVSGEGKVLWKLPIGDRIISDVTQIDYFNNGKLQYFFSTSKAIHIIDRLGNYVDPFPLHLSSTNIEHVSVIDYDNSKKYRILIADLTGKLWMFDKEGKALDGWRPKDVGGSLAMAPRHHRIKGKDYLLAVRKDGKVFLMNRRGEDIRKFPVDLKAEPSGDYSLEIGSSLENTNFVIVSRDGFKIKFSITGKIQSREALMKTLVTSNFTLINEKTNKSYLVLQQDGKQLTLADESGKRVITNNLSSLKADDIQFYDFGSGDVFITLIDRTQGFSYVYDGQGNLLTSPPIESSAIEIRPFNGDQFRIFFIHGRSLTIQSL